MAKHYVLFGDGAQTLYHVPYDVTFKSTIATSPTYSIVDLTHGNDSAQHIVVAAGTVATVSTASEALTAAAGIGTAYRRRLTVANPGEFTEGRTYLLRTADSGQREAVTIDRVDTTGGHVYTMRDLGGAYPTGSMLVGLELQATFPESYANDEDETVEDDAERYAVIWDYALAGRPCHCIETIRVQRYNIQPWISVDYMLQGHLALQGRTDERMRNAALQVATEEVAADLEFAGFLPQNYHGDNAARLAVRHRALAYIFENFHTELDSEVAAKHLQRYEKALHNMMHGTAPRGTVVIDESENQKDYRGTKQPKFRRP